MPVQMFREGALKSVAFNRGRFNINIIQHYKVPPNPLEASNGTTKNPKNGPILPVPALKPRTLAQQGHKSS